MNPYAAVILLALLGRWALHVAADALNARALSGELPPALRCVYDAERYRRSQEYTRARLRFGIVPETASLVGLLAFWLAGGFARLDDAVRALGLGAVPSGLLYLGTLGLAATVARLPFRWWSTFVIEERFGFNRTTPRTFWTDLVKGLALGAVLGGALLTAVLWLFDALGPSAWLWCWAASALFVVLVQFVAPTWILPLFNRFTPLADDGLRAAILDYARRVGFPLEDVFLVDGSRRSTKANAFFTGFGRRKRVGLFDTLVETLGADEVLGVVAHEVGHYRRGHVLRGLALGIAQLGLFLFLLSRLLARPRLFAAFGVAAPSVHAGLVFFALLAAPLDFALGLAMHALSRRQEFQADAFARATTGSGAPLAAALKRLSADSLANPTPHPLYVALHYSHPPLLARLRALDAA